jgi:peroxiredoxin
MRLLALSMLLGAGAAGAMPDTGKTAPDFALASNGGKNIRLSELRGQVVLMNFWATWCSPCRQEMPLLSKLYTQYRPVGFTLLGINIDGDRTKAARMLKELGVEFPVLYDDKKTVANAYKPDGMPTTLLIDRSGRVRYIHRGYQPGFERNYEAEIRELLKE